MGRKTRYEILVTPEFLSQVSSENMSLMKEFLEYMKATGKAQTTIDSYEDDIKIFYVWNVKNNNNKFFVDLNKREIMKYQNFLVNELQQSSSRVRRLKSALSSMSNFIESMMDDLYPNFKSIINKVPAPPLEKVREKTVLTDDMVENLLSTLVEKQQYQKACLFALACYSGARKSELLRFKVSFFKDENIIYGSLYKTSEKIKTKGRGVNGKQLYKYVIVAKFKPYLDLWLHKRQELGIDSDDLFVSKRGGDWDTMEVSTADSYSEYFSEILGTPIYLHACRHFFVTSLCRCNIPNSIIKDIVGWDNEVMIQTYNQMQVDDELGKYFDKDGIKKTQNKTINDIL